MLVLFLVITVWWLVLKPWTSISETNDLRRYIWGASYQLLAIIGGIGGLFIARSWGGFKSVLGRTIVAFSVGLLFQAFGQSVYSLYNIFLKVEAPYPSIGDIGFFGSIPFYIYGTVLLARASGVSVSLRAFVSRVQAILIPLGILALSYFVFLRTYQLDWSNLLQVLLDFGYPLGQAMYVSAAILTFVLVRNVLGGVMRKVVLFFLVALVAQYLCDFNFLFQFSRSAWYVGGFGDYLYATSYFLMAMSLVNIGVTFKQISES